MAFKIIRSKKYSNFYKSYFLNKKKAIPFISAKIAVSKDYQTINKKKKWITNNTSRKIVHVLRSKYDCIISTSKTINIDNPLLNCRIKGLNNEKPEGCSECWRREKNNYTSYTKIKKRENFISKYLSKDTSVKLSIPNKGPGSIETEYDEAIAIPNVIKGIINAEKNKFDVAIISCFSDPGLTACREKVSIPVIGSGENSILLAGQLGNQISILSPLSENKETFKNKLF